MFWVQSERNELQKVVWSNFSQMIVIVSMRGFNHNKLLVALGNQYTSYTQTLYKQLSPLLMTILDSD